MSLRTRLGDWIESPAVQRAIVGLIVFNAVTLGLETSDSLMARWGGLLHAVDAVVLAVFVVELGIKLYAQGLRFFRSAWNVFDFVVVGIALLPASGPLSVLRALRVLRVLRLISLVPRLRFVVEALLRAELRALRADLARRKADRTDGAGLVATGQANAKALGASGA